MPALTKSALLALSTAASPFQQINSWLHDIQPHKTSVTVNTMSDSESEASRRHRRRSKKEQVTKSNFLDVLMDESIHGS